MSAQGRNEPCACGSGRKFKKCCMAHCGPTAEESLRSAVEHVTAGRLLEAASLCERVLVEAPQHAEALHLSGHVADRMGDAERAFDRIGRAIALSPDNAAYRNSLGIAFGQRGRTVEAIASFRRALQLRPQYPQALNNLANVLHAEGEFDEAEDCFRRMIALSSQIPGVHGNLASLLQAQGRLDEAAQSFAHALELDPRNPAAQSNRLMNLVYQPGVSPERLFEAARTFGQALEASLARHRLPHTNVPDPGRRIRIGYVSADLRRHSVAYFLEPILARHDRSRFEITCYSTGARRDSVTERLEGLADRWIPARGLGDAALAERIRADAIDILVDLSGHTAGNRLAVFARKPAPIQVTWLGFLASTGLDCMDYRLTDEVADPPQCGETEHTERLMRLPSSCVCYRAGAAAPPVGPLPALARGSVTFASFNTPAKHNPEVFALWAGILRALPGSRLVLKGRGLDKGRLASATRAAFVAQGVAAERIVLQAYETDEGAHLDRYNEIDIGLDPFPHNGVTTTCGALWMGVPVIALRGDRHSSRMCASVLNGAGLAEFVADSRAGYQSLALGLAGDLARLATMRDGMRARLRASPLMDEIAATREIENAFREAWRDWCGERNDSDSHPDTLGTMLRVT